MQFDPKDGLLRIIMDSTKRIIIYPCRDGQSLNFVCIRPDPYGEISASASTPYISMLNLADTQGRLEFQIFQRSSA